MPTSILGEISAKPIIETDPRERFFEAPEIESSVDADRFTLLLFSIALVIPSSEKIPEHINLHRGDFRLS